MLDTKKLPLSAVDVTHTDDGGGLLPLKESEIPIPENLRLQDKTENKIITYKRACKSLLFTGISLSGSIAIIQLDEFLSKFILKDLSNEAIQVVLLIQVERGITTALLSAPLSALSILFRSSIKSEKPDEEVALLFQAGLISSFILSLPVIIFAATNEYILLGFNQNSQISGGVQDFFWGFMPGIVPFFLRIPAVQLIIGKQKRIMTLVFDATTTAISLSLTYIISYGLGPIATQGIRGYGYAKTLSTVLDLITYAAFLKLNPQFNHYRLFSPHCHLKKHIFQIFKLGAPIMVAIIGEIGVQFASVLMAGALGSDYLAAQSVLSSYNSLLVISILGFFRAISILVSGAVAQNRMNDVNRYILLGVILTSIPPILLLCFSLTIPDQLSAVFISPNDVNPKVKDMLRLNLPLAALNDLLDSIRLVLMGALLGKQDIIIPTVGNLITQLLIMLPLMYILSFLTSLGLAGLQTGNMIGIVIMSALMVHRLLLSGRNINSSDNTQRLTNAGISQDVLNESLEDSFETAEDSVGSSATLSI